MRLTHEDYAAAEAEMNNIEPLSPSDFANLENTPAFKAADAQFGRRPIHERGIDQVRYAIAEINRPALPVITAIATAHVNELNRVANDEREPLARVGCKGYEDDYTPGIGVGPLFWVGLMAFAWAFAALLAWYGPVMFAVGGGR